MQSTQRLQSFFADRNPNEISESDVYAFALQGLNVNQVNECGDTALHSAIRYRNFHLVEPLLRCGASPLQANALGRTGVEEAASCGNERTLQVVESYSPGIQNAIARSSLRTIQRLTNKWISVISVLNDYGETATQMAHQISDKSNKALQCFNLIDSYAPQSMLIMSVLANDADSFVSHLDYCRSNLIKLNLSASIGNFGESLLEFVLRNQNERIISAYIDAFKEDGKDFAAAVSHRVLSDCSNESYVVYHRTLLGDYSEAIAALIDSVAFEETPGNGKRRHLTFLKDGSGCSAGAIAFLNKVPIERFKRILSATCGRILVDRNCDDADILEMIQKSGSHSSDEKSAYIEAIKHCILSSAGSDLLIELIMSKFSFAGIDLVEDKAWLSGGKWSEFERIALESRCALRDMNLAIFDAVMDFDVARLRQMQVNNMTWRTSYNFNLLIAAIVHAAGDNFDEQFFLFLINTQPQLIDQIDDFGRNALHYAYAHPNLEIGESIALLINKYSSVTNEPDMAADCFGLVPLQYRLLREKCPIVDDLRKFYVIDLKCFAQDFALCLINEASEAAAAEQGLASRIKSCHSSASRHSSARPLSGYESPPQDF